MARNTTGGAKLSDGEELQGVVSTSSTLSAEEEVAVGSTSVQDRGGHHAALRRSRFASSPRGRGGGGAQKTESAPRITRDPQTENGANDEGDRTEKEGGGTERARSTGEMETAREWKRLARAGVSRAPVHSDVSGTACSHQRLLFFADLFLMICVCVCVRVLVSSELL